MSQRITIGLKRDTDWRRVAHDLTSIGAEFVREPAPELPDVLVAIIPDEMDAETFIRRAREAPGVRYAERDSWRFASGASVS